MLRSRTPMTLPRRLLSALLFAALPAFGAAQALMPDTKTELLRAVDTIVRERAFVPGVKLDQWPQHVDKQKKALDDAKTPDEFVRAMNAALRSFGISHMRMLTPGAERRRVTHQRTELGLRVQFAQSVLKVMGVTPESQAANAGIATGDDIVAVDGKPPESVEVLEGADGTPIALRVRKADGATSDIELVRKVVSMDRADTLTWLDQETAVLHVHSFNKGYDRKIVENLCKEAARARYLLLDLRGNGGGAINNLRHLLGNFLPGGSVIGTFVSRELVRGFVAAGQGDGTDPLAVARWSDRKFATDPRATPPITARVAVLVNRGSASASEITAAALRESLDAPLVGARTAGAVLASTFGKLPQNYGLQYPQSDYVTAKGIRLERQPLVPDLVVGGAPERPASRPTSQPAPASRPRAESAPTRETLAADPVVKAAVELIKKRVPKPVPPPPASRPSSAPASEPGSRPRGRRR